MKDITDKQLEEQILKDPDTALRAVVTAVLIILKAKKLCTQEELEEALEVANKHIISTQKENKEDWEMSKKMMGMFDFFGFINSTKDK